MRIMKENMRTGNLPANMKKNRVLQIIPCEKMGQPLYKILILMILFTGPFSILSPMTLLLADLCHSDEFSAPFYYQMTSTESFCP